MGVAVGQNGQGYMLGGKWTKGDQVTKLHTSDTGVVMHRRTTAQGGKLSGVAHQLPKYEQQLLDSQKGARRVFSVYKNGRLEKYDQFGNKLSSEGPGTYGNA